MIMPSTEFRQEQDNLFKEMGAKGHLDFGDANRTDKHLAFGSKTRVTHSRKRLSHVNHDYYDGPVRQFTEQELAEYQKVIDSQ